MARFRVRLQSPVSRHYTVTFVSADSADDAIAFCQRVNQRLVDDPNQPHDHPYEVAYCIERGDPIPPLEEWGCVPPEPGGEEGIGAAEAEILAEGQGV